MDEIRLQKLEDLGEDLGDELLRLRDRKGHSFSFPIADNLKLEKLKPGMLWLHGGYTGHGKSSLALNCALYWATRDGNRVTFISEIGLIRQTREKLRKLGSFARALTIEEPSFLTEVGKENTDYLVLDGLHLHTIYSQHYFAFEFKKKIERKNLSVFATTQLSRQSYQRVRSNQAYNDWSSNQVYVNDFRSREMMTCDIASALWRDQNRFQFQIVKDRQDILPSSPPVMLTLNEKGKFELEIEK